MNEERVPSVVTNQRIPISTSSESIIISNINATTNATMRVIPIGHTILPSETVF